MGVSIPRKEKDSRKSRASRTCMLDQETLPRRAIGCSKRDQQHPASTLNLGILSLPRTEPNWKCLREKDISVIPRAKGLLGREMPAVQPFFFSRSLAFPHPLTPIWEKWRSGAARMSFRFDHLGSCRSWMASSSSGPTTQGETKVHPILRGL